jgi:hypothetical protein
VAAVDAAPGENADDEEEEAGRRRSLTLNRGLL